MIKIVAVGRIKEKAMKDLIAEYGKRLSAYTKFEIEEVSDEPTLQNNSQSQNDGVKLKEGERILSRIKEKEYVILLYLKGRMMDSVAFSEKMNDLYTEGHSDLTFVIGGSLGVSEDVKKRADLLWKLSDLTFPHQLVRLILTEQIYRAYKILRKEPYHK